MEQDVYYNRVMSEGLEKFLKDEKDIKCKWLIEFVKSHKELDFQTGSNENKQGTRRSWFSIYRGTSRILKLSCGVREKLTIEVADSYRDPKLDEKGFYKIKEWDKCSKEYLKKKFEKLIENINGSEDHGKYYIKNGKKMEGFYQNLVSRRYSIYHKSDDKLLIFDKEFELGYRDEEVKKRELIDTKVWVNNIRCKIMNKFINNNWMIPDELNVKKINVEETSISTECDFVGINNKGDIVLLEVKRKADEEKLALAPLQVATYYKILERYIGEELSKLQQVIFGMIKQKQELGLINENWELPKKLSGKIKLAIVVGGKNINPDTIEKFKIVKKAVKSCKIPEIDYYTCGEDGSIELVEDLDSLKNFDGYDMNDDSYKNNEMAWQAKLICADKDKKKEEQVFYGAQGGGLYDGKAYSHVLQCGKKNLFEWIRDKEKFPQYKYKSAIGYFDAHGIPWHKGCKGCKECEGCEVCKECKGGPTGNTLSSQIACLNHLFAIREDYNAVLAIINGIEINGKKENFDSVLFIPKEYDKKKNKKAEKQNKDNSENEDKNVYISFEVVSKNNLLGEGTPTRGANCTSIDALIYAKQGDEKWLIVIEWKYTESYDKDDKSEGSHGDTRMKRYNHLIKDSRYLEEPKDNKYQGSVYYQEPFYQLMRQTLWAEEVIKHRKNGGIKPKESFEAEQYLHLHVIPKGNKELLNKGFHDRGKDMKSVWTSMLTEEGKKRYKTIDPEELLAPIADSEKFPKYKGLINYLRTRYWDRPTETTNDNQNPSAK